MTFTPDLAGARLRHLYSGKLGTVIKEYKPKQGHAIIEWDGDSGRQLPYRLDVVEIVAMRDTGAVNAEYDSPLDHGIARAVEVLNSVNIETYESCEGGAGHCYPEPTVRFHGDYSEGFRALAVALQHKLPVMALRRIWVVTHGEPVGPSWELTFSKLAAKNAIDED